ncbi:protein maelstrom homolog [Anopheles maculipalpis]|uniref:protein maelstrom homolog n=1 Tax=Anopheles maculipalpis TaxID=1496333 RepID=UPI0021590622|nr:protein maelstrom homolog [Anopheles maculipalpis]
MSKKNAFFYFMLEYKGLEEAKGRRFKNLSEVTPLAGDIWQKMDAAKRERYILMANPAKNAKVQPEAATVPEAAQAKCVTKELLQERLKRVVSVNELVKENFYLISIGYFCRTIDDVYIPAEIGVIKYSLKYGVQERFHMLIDHEKLPTGMAYEALHHSNGTHALPLPPHGLGVKDYNEIASKLLDFLQAEDEIPMLFTAAKEASAMNGMLLNILGEHIQNRALHICSVAELYMQLQHASARCNQSRTAFKTVHIAQKLLDDDVYSYTEGISCDYHEYHSLLTHCVLSQCIRWAYSISRDCCADMGIELIPGFHMPGRKDLEHHFDEISGTISDDHASSDNEHLNDCNVSFVSYGTSITSLPLEPGTIEDLPINIKPDRAENNKQEVPSGQVHVSEHRNNLQSESIVQNMGLLNLKESDTPGYRLTARGKALIYGDEDAFSVGFKSCSELMHCPKCFHKFKIVNKE